MSIRARVLSIARGEYKPKPSDPKIWFTLMRSLAEVLSDENRSLFKVIQEAKPQSITSLAELTGRKTSNLSRTLKTMSNFGFVEMKREKKTCSSCRHGNRIPDRGLKQGCEDTR